MPVLEAMSRGTPVVASSTTSIPEVAGDAAAAGRSHRRGRDRAGPHDGPDRCDGGGRPATTRLRPSRTLHLGGHGPRYARRVPTGRGGSMKVTLISTVKDCADGVDAFLASLAAQTRAPDEVVIVDGGSSRRHRRTVRRRRHGDADRGTGRQHRAGSQRGARRRHPRRHRRHRRRLHPRAHVARRDRRPDRGGRRRLDGLLRSAGRRLPPGLHGLGEPPAGCERGGPGHVQPVGAGRWPTVATRSRRSAATRNGWRSARTCGSTCDGASGASTCGSRPTPSCAGGPGLRSPRRGSSTSGTRAATRRRGCIRTATPCGSRPTADSCAALASKRTWPKLLAAAGGGGLRADARAARVASVRGHARTGDGHRRGAGADRVHRHREDGRVRGGPGRPGASLSLARQGRSAPTAEPKRDRRRELDTLRRSADKARHDGEGARAAVPRCLVPPGLPAAAVEPRRVRNGELALRGRDDHLHPRRHRLRGLGRGRGRGPLESLHLVRAPGRGDRGPLRPAEGHDRGRPRSRRGDVRDGARRHIHLAHRGRRRDRPDVRQQHLHRALLPRRHRADPVGGARTRPRGRQRAGRARSTTSRWRSGRACRRSCSCSDRRRSRSR